MLVFSKTAGFRHESIDEGITAIRDMGSANNFAVIATEDAAIISDGGLEPFEAVVFLNTTGDFLNDEQQAAFERYIVGGGGFVGVHAADAEYDWPWYGELVGAYFDEHPDVQEAVIRTAADHPANSGLPDPWVRTDEWYNYRTNPREAGVDVVLTLDETSYDGGTMGEDHPIAWSHPQGAGRAFYTGLGHTPESYPEPLFRDHLLGGFDTPPSRPSMSARRRPPRRPTAVRGWPLTVTFSSRGNRPRHARSCRICLVLRRRRSSRLVRSKSHVHLRDAWHVRRATRRHRYGRRVVRGDRADYGHARADTSADTDSDAHAEHAAGHPPRRGPHVQGHPDRP